MRKDIEFKTEDGIKLRGWHYLPEKRTGKVPTIVMAHGFSAVKEMYLDRFADAFAAAGLGALVFDNRNFGASDGEPRQEIDPWQQVSDYRDAITFAETLPETDPARIGIWGSSYSGGHVMVVGAIDRRVKCVVAQVPLASGHDNARRLIRADYLAGVHPRFDRAKAEGFLAKTTIARRHKVRELSKGMVTQLHLALVMAIDARLLVLDEPTLGLDILYRKQFYDSLLNDYFDRTRTIVVTTHQVEEIQDVLTDFMFVNRGRIVLECSMEEFESRYLEVMVTPDHVAEARALGPIRERQVFGRSILLFDRADRQQLAALGELRTPSIADLFVALIGNETGNAQGAAA